MRWQRLNPTNPGRLPLVLAVVAVAAGFLLLVSIRPALALPPSAEVGSVSVAGADTGWDEMAFTESDIEEGAAVSDVPGEPGDWWITPALLLSFVAGAWYLAITRSRDPLE